MASLQPPTQERPIRVNFSVHEFWNEKNKPTKFMGYISHAEMVQIMQAVESYKFGASKCMYKPCIKYTAKIDEDTDAYNRHVFELCDFFWGYRNTFPVCGGTKVKDKVSGTTAEADNMFLCAGCLRDGKCTDAFMRRTIGAVLFPQFYANEKSK